MSFWGFLGDLADLIYMAWPSGEAKAKSRTRETKERELRAELQGRGYSTEEIEKIVAELWPQQEHRR